MKENENKSVKKILTSVFHVSIISNNLYILFKIFLMAVYVFIKNSSVTASIITFLKMCFSHLTKKISYIKFNNLYFSNNKITENFCDNLAVFNYKVKSIEIEPNLNDNIIKM